MKQELKSNEAAKVGRESVTVIPILGRDEMNVVEFPIGPITPSDQQTIEVVHDVRDRKSKRIVERKLLITGSDRFGLPRPADEQVLVGLSSLTQEYSRHERKVYFSQYHLLQTIGWEPTGRSYRRLADSFDRLTSVYLRFSNSWWDKSEQEYRTRGFHLIESFELCSEDRYANQRQKTGKRSLDLSHFVWSDVMWKSIGDGYIRSIDMDLFRKIAKGRRREVPLRLYRWLGKQFWPREKRVVRFDLMRLAEGTLGLAEKYPSQAGRILSRAAAVLIDVGFLSDFELVRSRTQSGFEVVFVKAESKTAKKHSRTASQSPALGADKSRITSGLERPNEMRAWAERFEERILQSAESEAIASNFGNEFERKMIAAERKRGTPIKNSGRLRLDFIRRYLDPEFRKRCETLLSGK